MFWILNHRIRISSWCTTSTFRIRTTPNCWWWPAFPCGPNAKSGAKMNSSHSSDPCVWISLLFVWEFGGELLRNCSGRLLTKFMGYWITLKLDSVKLELFGVKKSGVSIWISLRIAIKPPGWEGRELLLWNCSETALGKSAANRGVCWGSNAVRQSPIYGLRNNLKAFIT